MSVDAASARAGWRLLPVFVFVVLAAGSITAFIVARHVVDDQEGRLLAERTAEVAAVLEVGLARIESSLQVLGPLGSSEDPTARTLFEESARDVLGPAAALTRGAIGVATEDSDGYVVVAAVGDGLVPGASLDAGRVALADRARENGRLVSDLVIDGSQTMLVVASPVRGSAAVAYQQSAVNPAQPAPATPQSPFSELHVAVYASEEADPAKLLVTTETDVPLTGRVERAPFSVGGDRWLLAAKARDPLAGPLAHALPWFFLSGGVLTALLASAVVWSLARRRAYAVAQVSSRTAELRDALGELHETRAFLERLVTAGPAVVWRVTLPEQGVSYVSPNIERLLGITEDESQAAGSLEALIHADDRPDFDEALDRLAAGVSEREQLEHRLVVDDHPARWVSVVLVPESDEDGAVVAALGYIVDIDDRRRAEHAQREAQGAAEAANRAKSEFLSRMSHELRTPLNAVLGFAQLLELEDLNEAERDSVAHILKGGHHLLDLINEVLDISRIEAGDLALSPEAVHARELVQEAVDLVRPLVEQHDIQLVVDRSAACNCYVFADRQRVKQVLLNLLSNAVKYNRTRGTIAVTCDQSTATRVRIAVADTGPGIPAERMNLLFTAFERLGAEHSSVEGTGIGLALSQRLSEAMGGTLTAASALGQGSTFTLELPRVEGPVERYERLNGSVEQPIAEPHPRRQMVLHIEDNLSNLKLVERVLAQRADVQVVAAMQGRLGLELAREHQPVLILLDLHLPDLDGEQVLQRLRDDESTAAIPVVIVSADATPGQVQRLLTAGASAYLTKPVDVRELLRLLDQTLAVDLTEESPTAAAPRPASQDRGR